MTWAWLLIAGQPAVEEKLQREVDEVLAGRMPGFEDLSQLKYTAMVFAEAIRLYPPAPAFGRRPKEEIELGGYRVPARSSVFLSPYVT